jgi:hypothetical protein
MDRGWPLTNPESGDSASSALQDVIPVDPVRWGFLRPSLSMSGQLPLPRLRAFALRVSPTASRAFDSGSHSQSGMGQPPGQTVGKHPNVSAGQGALRGVPPAPVGRLVRQNGHFDA